MRTTLEVEDDLLETAKDLAKKEGRTVGQVISSLAREALRTRSAVVPVRNGVPLFLSKTIQSGVAARPDLALVNTLRDEP